MDTAVTIQKYIFQNPFLFQCDHMLKTNLIYFYEAYYIVHQNSLSLHSTDLQKGTEFSVLNSPFHRLKTRTTQTLDCNIPLIPKHHLSFPQALMSTLVPQNFCKVPSVKALFGLFFELHIQSFFQQSHCVIYKWGLINIPVCTFLHPEHSHLMV